MTQESKNDLKAVFAILAGVVGVAIIVTLALAPVTPPHHPITLKEPIVHQLTVRNAIVTCYSFGSDFVSASGDVTLPPGTIAIKEPTGKTLWIAEDCTVEGK